VLCARAGADPPQTVQVRPLVRAHAHNDYRHERPLLDALDRGFCSVEADIFLEDGQLLIGHDRQELRPDRTLEALYLEPLNVRIAERGGGLFSGELPLTLLIDIKSEADETYARLHQVLSRYTHLVTRVENEAVIPGPVTVVISGNRPLDQMVRQNPRYAGFDGRLEDLDSDIPTHLMPLISDRWSSHFRWNGVGEFNSGESERLRELVEKAHRRGRRIRFWAIPDRESAWKVVYEAGVDLINTDNLNGLAEFLLKREPVR
jgi:hypothetical protein